MPRASCHNRGCTLNQAIKQKIQEIHAWERILSKYENYRKEVEKPASLGVLWTRIHMNNAYQILNIMGNIAGYRILDIGCGGGWFARLISEKEAKYVGMDLSPPFCQIALTRIRHEGMEGDIICGDAEHLPFRNYVFESAFTYEAMHHLPRPYEGICEALRVSNSFTLGDEPAKLPKSVEFLIVNMLKRSFKEGEPSKYESYRFDPKALKLSLEKKGYVVTVKRQWSYVPKIFSRFEHNLIVVKAYLLIYSLLMKFFKPFSHSMTAHIQPKCV